MTPKEINDIDKLRQRMEAFEPTDVPDQEALWANIEAQLPTSKEAKIIVLPWWKRPLWRGAAVVILLLGLAAYLALQTTEPTPMAPLATNTSTSTSAEEPMVQKAEQHEKLDAEATERANHSSRPQPVKETILAAVSEEAETMQKPSETETARKETKEGKEDNKEQIQSDPQPEMELTEYFEPIEILTKRSKTQQTPSTFNVQLLASNSSSSNSTMQGLGALSPSARPLPEHHGKGGHYAHSVSSLKKAPRYEEKITNVKHRLPVRFALLGNYNINTRWSAGIGLSYTLLSSELSAGDDFKYYQNKQTLHYLGIPVQISYHWLQLKQFDLYTTLGGELAFGLYGKMDIDQYADERHYASRQQSIDNIPVQSSLFAAMGAQYNFLKHLGIYCEPGLSYYIDNHSSLITLYNEKPLNFNLNVGIRYTLPQK